jgi:hypothetical protein
MTCDGFLGMNIEITDKRTSDLKHLVWHGIEYCWAMGWQYIQTISPVHCGTHVIGMARSTAPKRSSTQKTGTHGIMHAEQRFWLGIGPHNKARSDAARTPDSEQAIQESS